MTSNTGSNWHSLTHSLCSVNGNSFLLFPLSTRRNPGRTSVGEQEGLSPDNLSASLQHGFGFSLGLPVLTPNWPTPFLGSCPNSDTLFSHLQEFSLSCPAPNRISGVVPVMECNSTVCLVVPWPGCLWRLLTLLPRVRACTKRC